MINRDEDYIENLQIRKRLAERQGNMLIGCPIKIPSYNEVAIRQIAEIVESGCLDDAIQACVDSINTCCSQVKLTRNLQPQELGALQVIFLSKQWKITQSAACELTLRPAIQAEELRCDLDEYQEPVEIYPVDRVEKPA